MLKLLKHDIKDSYLEVVILNLLSIGLAFLAFIAAKIAINSGNTGNLTFLVLTFGAWLIAICAALFIVLNSIIKSFHKKLFTNQGYLTLTTPVSIDKILLSKIIVNMLWILSIVVSVVISFIIVMSSFEALEIFTELFKIIADNPLEVFKAIFSGLVSSLNLIITLLFVLVLCNIGRLKKRKQLFGLIIYIGISYIVSLSNPFNNITAITRLNEYIISKNWDYIFGQLINIAWTVAFYFLSRFFIKNKLELE